eukprot:gene19938-biopygen23522
MDRSQSSTSLGRMAALRPSVSAAQLAEWLVVWLDSTNLSAPCTHCNGTRFDVFEVAGQSVVHVICLTCGHEWVE